MNNEKRANWSSTEEHPSDDELLRFIDGEQSREDAEAVQFHLKVCWSCRVRAEKLNTVISSFVEFRGQVIKPVVKIPDNRGNFKMRLNKAVVETKAQSFSLSSWWSKLVNFLAAAKSRTKKLAPPASEQLGVISSFSPFNFLNDARNRRLLASYGAAVLLFSILITYLFWIPAFNPVSAEELLNKAYAARQAQIKNKELPVIYQQVQIKHRDAAGGEISLKAEVWQDETYSRIRQSVNESSNASENSAGNGNGAANERVLTGLSEILKANNYTPAQPFSVPGLRSWRNSLSEKKETVEEDKTTDGIGVLRLKTEEDGVVTVGKLLSTTLTVRQDDYHPVEHLFVVKTDGGEEEYFVRETSFAVISLNSLSPDFFGEKPGTVLVAKASPKPEAVAPAASPSESPALQLNSDKPAGNSPSLNAGVASPELEVEVLELLHQAGADLGEQVGVEREPNGPVKINGVVESLARKNQLLNALRSVGNNRAVRINIQTVEEALAAEQRKKTTNPTSSPPIVQMETRQIEGVSFPAEAQVREYFARQGKGDDAAREYAARTVNNSAQAMRFLYALKRLKNQMKAEDFGRLAPDARAKLLGLVKSYARSYESEVSVLRRELQPVFGGGGGGGNAVTINSDADLFAAIERLFDAGAASNQAVSNALATGRGKTGGNSLQSAEFWRNLASAEAIAERLQNVK